MKTRRLTFVFILLWLGTLVEGGLEQFAHILKGANDIAKLLGTSSAGQISRGRDCVINWSYEGLTIGLSWKYMGLCTDSCTKETSKAIRESRGGAVEHCLADLMEKLSVRQEL